MILSEKAQYLKGLMDGLNIDASEPTGRVLKAMQELLEEICTTVDTIDSDVDDIVEFCETIDEDVSDIEEDLYGEDDEDDEDDDCCCDDDCDCDCDCCDDDDCCEFETVCPNCGDTIELTEEMVNEGSIECPNCGEHLEFDIERIEGDEE
mgnify:FL=1